MQDRVQDISRQIDDLGRRCSAIGSILEYLDHLTSETGVVSINANIKVAGADGGARQVAVMAAGSGLVEFRTGSLETKGASGVARPSRPVSGAPPATDRPASVPPTPAALLAPGTTSF